jgi:hypothetical protein
MKKTEFGISSLISATALSACAGSSAEIRTEQGASAQRPNIVILYAERIQGTFWLNVNGLSRTSP